MRAKQPSFRIYVYLTNMDKTPKLKSRTLGLSSSRGQKLTALCQKQFELDKNMQTDFRPVLKGEHKISKNSDCKHDSLNKDEEINLQEHMLNRNSEMITPVKTQKMPTLYDDESPSAKESPDLQSNFARTFGSPEIEISWDYSCSQVPKGTVVPILHNKQRRWRFPVNLPPLLNLQPHLVPERGMSEEERREKIAYLKVFREKLLRNAGPTSPLSTKQNGGKTEEKFSEILGTDNLVFNETIQDQCKDQIDTYAKQYDIDLEKTQPVEDESFECSSEIGNSRLHIHKKSGNINTPRRSSPESRSKISTKELFPSISCAKANLFPKNSNVEMDNNNQINIKLDVCKSKVKDPRCIQFDNHNHKTNFHLHNSVRNKGNVINRQFEEQISVEGNESQKFLNVETRIKTSKEKNDDIYFLLDDSIDEIMVKCSQDVEEELLSQESGKSIVQKEENVSKKHVASPLIKSSKVIKTCHKQTVHVQNYNGSDKIDRLNTNLNSFINKEKFGSGTKADNVNTTTKINISQNKGVTILPSSSSSRHRQSQRITPGATKVTDSDFTALLNDDDGYLTSIDFSIIDTACASHKSAASLVTQSKTATQLKIYTEHEIEAKRIEALKKLRKKRGKT